jgi:hypothetical protein
VRPRSRSSDAPRKTSSINGSSRVGSSSSSSSTSEAERGETRPSAVAGVGATLLAGIWFEPLEQGVAAPDLQAAAQPSEQVDPPRRRTGWATRTRHRVRRPVAGAARPPHHGSPSSSELHRCQPATGRAAPGSSWTFLPRSARGPCTSPVRTCRSARRARVCRTLRGSRSMTSVMSQRWSVVGQVACWRG